MGYVHIDVRKTNSEITEAILCEQVNKIATDAREVVPKVVWQYFNHEYFLAVKGRRMAINKLHGPNHNVKHQISDESKRQCRASDRAQESNIR